MNKNQALLLGIILLVFGAIWTIIASFNLKHDAAWISVLMVSVISTIIGVRMIDIL